MNAAEDFFNVVLIGHVIALAMNHFNMHSMEDPPKHEDLHMIQDETRSAFKQLHFHQALGNMLKKHIHHFTSDCFGVSSPVSDDGLAVYAKELLSLGLLYHQFKDAIREGDGDRVFLCWKFFLPIFKKKSPIMLSRL